MIHDVIIGQNIIEEPEFSIIFRDINANNVLKLMEICATQKDMEILIRHKEAGD